VLPTSLEKANGRLFTPQCLRSLKEIGFQIGSGVMIGLPGQKLRDLAADLTFFREQEFDMIGMGPYITVRDHV
jgi:biotin synthase